MIYIIKRDGRKVPYSIENIKNALEKAYIAVDGEKVNKDAIDNRISDISTVSNIIDDIIKTKNEKTGKEFTVEEIQDLVETNLLSHTKRLDVAKAYILYREKRNEIREQKSQLMQKVNEKINATSVENSNANIDERSFGGREQEASSIIQKELAYQSMRPSVRDGIKDGYIYMHDLSKYKVGMHNCLHVDFEHVFKNGFITRNGDVRPPKSLSSACQQVAVIFQCQSQVQFGGVGSTKIDMDLKPFVKISFKKHFIKNYLKMKSVANLNKLMKLVDEMELNNEFGKITLDEINSFKNSEKDTLNSIIKKITKKYGEIEIGNKKLPRKTFNMSILDLEDEGRQSFEALYHNLNTLESRQGSQVPFTSINFGRDTSIEGRLVSKWILNASIEGIGKHRNVSIFPISIFSYKRGVNANPEDPNYDLKKLAIESMTRRIYPNFANGNFSQAHEDENDNDTIFATMGCVEGNEVIRYRINNNEYVESFIRVWDRLSNLFDIKLQDDGKNHYIDLNNVTIFDTKENNFVKCHRIIRNTSNKWYNIKFNNGRAITCTEDHPFETENRGIIFAKDLLNDDKIIRSIPYEIDELNTKFVNDDYAWFLGFIMCNGYYDNGSIRASIAFYDEDDIADKFIKTVKKYFNLNTDIVEQHRDAKGIYKDLVVRSNKIDKQAIILREDLKEIFSGTRKIERQIPNEVFNWNKSARLSFLAGMIDADGYINPIRDLTTVQTGTINKEITLQQLKLAESLGIEVSLYRNHHIKGSSKVRYILNFLPTEELLSKIVCKKKINHIAKRNYRLNDINHILTVKDKEYFEKEQYSYDVTTESGHFEVSGIYSHNCRTLLGYDVNGLGYKRTGRGNIAPCTIILPKLGIEYGICDGKRKEADIEGFWKKFDEILELTKIALLDRYKIIASQSPKAGEFMYANGTMKCSEDCVNDVSEAMKHGTLALGYIGIAEMCQALFGKNHAEDPEVWKFAYSVVERINKFAKQATEETHLNFSCYATPAESLCHTAANMLRKQYGPIPNVCDREYLTNSHHVPVWEKVSIYEKINLEAPFAKLATGGCILYVELDSTSVHNTKAIEEIIDYAFSPEVDASYLAFNFPLDTCQECGFKSEINDACPVCGSKNIKRLRRVTGYLTTDYSKFNKGKIDEVNDRFKHSTMTKF